MIFHRLRIDLLHAHATSGDDSFLIAARAYHMQRKLLHTSNESFPFFLRYGVHLLKRINLRKLYHNWNQLLWQQFIECITHLFVLRRVEIPQDTCVKLFYSKCRFQVDLYPDWFPFRFACIRRCGKHKWSADTEMRKQHFALAPDTKACLCFSFLYSTTM